MVIMLSVRCSYLHALTIQEVVALLVMWGCGDGPAEWEEILSEEGEDFVSFMRANCELFSSDDEAWRALRSNVEKLCDAVSGCGDGLFREFDDDPGAGLQWLRMCCLAVPGWGVSGLSCLLPSARVDAALGFDLRKEDDGQAEWLASQCRLLERGEVALLWG